MPVLHSEKKNKKQSLEPPWLSFSDALSALLFVFILTTFYVMWRLEKTRIQAAQKYAAQQAEYNAQISQLKKQSSEYDAILKSLKTTGESEEAGVKSIALCLRENKVAAIEDAKEKRISIRPRSVSDVATVAVFPLGQASFVEGPAREPVREMIATMRSCLAKGLQDIPELYNVRVVFEGHTDAIPVNSPIFASNWELSASRAAAILREFLCDEKSAKISCAKLEIADDAQIASQLQQLRDQSKRRIDFVAAGFAETTINRRTLCREDGSAEKDIVIDETVDAAFCREITKDKPEIERLRSILLPTYREEVNNIFTIQEMSSLWANAPGCLENPEKGNCKARLSALRRVDIRIEFRPKQDNLMQAPK